MAKYGPKRQPRKTPTLRDSLIDTIARSDRVTIAPGSAYDVACAKLVDDGVLIVIEETPVGRVYGFNRKEVVA